VSLNQANWNWSALLTPVNLVANQNQTTKYFNFSLNQTPY